MSNFDVKHSNETEPHLSMKTMLRLTGTSASMLLKLRTKVASTITNCLSTLLKQNNLTSKVQVENIYIKNLNTNLEVVLLKVKDLMPYCINQVEIGWQKVQNVSINR